MRILFDSKKEKYKSPFGCITPNENCILNIEIPRSCNTQKVKLFIADEYGFNMEVPFVKTEEKGEYETYKTEFSLFKTGLYFYFFKIETDCSSFSLFKQGNDTNIEEGDMWQLTCYDPSSEVSDDFKGKIMYQIFPDRFAVGKESDLSEKLSPFYIHKDVNETPVFMPDENGKVLNNDFYGGNLKGIMSSLPYLKKLGVGIIYLNPIFKAYSNHRYDTCDYKKIDPMLGTEEDFKNLCDAAHKLDIKIILDGVFSHTGSNSIYFDKDRVFGNGAYSDINSPYKSWFDFQEYPDKYTAWWGIDTLPCVNELDPSYMDYIIYNNDSVIKHWLNAGADGFRLDVVDEIPDKFVLELKKEMRKTKKNSFLIGEVWEDASNKISYGQRRKYFSDGELDSVMNYPFRELIIGFVKGEISGTVFKDRIMTLVENYPKSVVNSLMNMMSTHDTPRLLTLLGYEGEGMSKESQANYTLNDKQFEKAVSRLKLATVLQFTLPGMPCIYYGDEIGMEGFGDPFCRGFFKWDNVNTDILQFFSNIANLRNKSRALCFGDIEFGECTHNRIVFKRAVLGETLEITVTRGEGICTDGSSIFTVESTEGDAAINLKLIV